MLAARRRSTVVVEGGGPASEIYRRAVGRISRVGCDTGFLTAGDSVKEAAGKK